MENLNKKMTNEIKKQIEMSNDFAINTTKDELKDFKKQEKKIKHLENRPGTNGLTGVILNMLFLFVGAALLIPGLVYLSTLPTMTMVYILIGFVGVQIIVWVFNIVYLTTGKCKAWTAAISIMFGGFVGGILILSDNGRKE